MERYEIDAMSFTVEGDTMFAHNRAPITLHSVQQYLALAEQVIARHGCLFMITDATLSYVVEGDARRYVVEWGRSHRTTATAIYGTGVVIRAMMGLIVGAIRRFTRDKTGAPYEFFATEAEARSYIADQRRRFYAEHPERTMPAAEPPHPRSAAALSGDRT